MPPTEAIRSARTDGWAPLSTFLPMRSLHRPLLDGNTASMNRAVFDVKTQDGLYIRE